MEQSGAETMGSKLGTHVLGKNDGEYNSGPMFNAWGGAETTGSKLGTRVLGREKTGSITRDPCSMRGAGRGRNDGE